MRRKDREMSEKFALEVMDKASFGVLSLCNDGQVLSRILSFARKGKTIYFHSATSGEKVEALKDGAEVLVVFATDVHVPELYEEEELEFMVKEKGVSLLLSKVFTTEYASTMVKGRVRRAEDEEKVLALRYICEKYTPTKMMYFREAIEMSKDRVLVYAVDIEEISGKRKKFDSQGEEMKWQREE